MNCSGAFALSPSEDRIVVGDLSCGFNVYSIPSGLHKSRPIPTDESGMWLPVKFSDDGLIFACNMRDMCIVDKNAKIP